MRAMRSDAIISQTMCVDPTTVPRARRVLRVPPGLSGPRGPPPGRRRPSFE
jgi:hypothetical protein